ncbi:hypothetical protein BLNAU_1408 [Blattamonas nauphoetae]|uniref:RRM domain-containing protein n=1 Tax=Blattamonas nauphoetae TaxID=2049346 RepID=A0ABQ9YJ96_9EUKA|nr:hypothetical protein BLNAU_1408 [Blattamonas nauphoetae]
MAQIQTQNMSNLIVIEPNILVYPVEKLHFPIPKIFTISNLSSQAVYLDFKLPANSPFTLYVDHTTPLPPQSQIDCCISFTPPSYTPRSETAFLCVLGQEFPIHLQAVVPQTLPFMPQNVDFGVCPIGASESREFKVHNTTEAPIALSIDIRNVNPDVYFSNIGETIQPGTVFTLSIVYKPQYPLAHRFLGSASVAGIGPVPQFTAFHGGTEPSEPTHALVTPAPTVTSTPYGVRTRLAPLPASPDAIAALKSNLTEQSISASPVYHFLSQPNYGILVIKNLPPTVTMEQVNDIFSLWGEIKEIRRMAPPQSHLFVEFVHRKDARNALANEFDRPVAGIRLHIEFARPGGRRKAEFRKYWDDRLRSDEDDGLVAVLPQHAPPDPGAYTFAETRLRLSANRPAQQSLNLATLQYRQTNPNPKF